MRIRLLGTGTPTPSLRRMCSGYVVETGDDVIVFDHGFGAHHRLLELGIPATKVSHLFLTHLHYDHCGDYARLVLTLWDQGAGKLPELSVFGPPPPTQFSAALLGESGAFNSDLVARTSDNCSLRIFEARRRVAALAAASQAHGARPGRDREGERVDIGSLGSEAFPPLSELPCVPPHDVGRNVCLFRR
jgi:ribonuclease BN (tRNA processing enzyme)